MTATLIQKELRSILLSPRFAATLAVCSLLLLLSVYTGIQEYRQAQAQYDSATGLAEQSIAEATSWHAVIDKVYRAPDPMQIFVSGLTYDVGRWSEISAEQSVKLKHSANSDDPIFAVFRFIDFSFVVQVVFSLFALLFTYDAVNGERERGTLRLVFSNAVPRAQYLIAKCAGTWLGLVVPLCIPLLLSLLLVNLFQVPLTTAHWYRLGLLLLISLAYVTLFIVLGVMMSTFTKRSSVSFLLSLVVWIIFVLIVPRAGVMAAGQIVAAPQLAEVEGLRDGYAKDRWAIYYKDMENRMLSRQGGASSPDDAALWAQLKVEDSLRKIVQREIERYEGRLLEDWNRRKAAQQRLGLTLSRFSPASAFQLGAMALAGTDTEMKPRYEEAMNSYRKVFNEYVERKQAESGQVGGIVITMDSDGGFQIGESRDNQGLDISDKPRFTPPTLKLEDITQSVAIDLSLLVFGSMLMFAGAFVSFLRYDLR